MASRLRDFSNNLKQIPGKYWLFYLLVFAAGVSLRTHTVLNHDVAWLSVAAGRMMAGGGYSQDFFEINMPFAVAAYAPAQIIASLFDRSLIASVWIWIFLLIFHSGLLVATLRFTPRHKNEAQTSKAIWLLGLLTSLIFIPAYHFGQKEHLIAILITPFLILLCQHPSEQSRLLRIHITSTAALGFLIKPHFVALPLLLIGCQAYTEGSLHVFRSLEAAVLVVVAIIISVLGLLLFPDWFECATWAIDLYGAYGRDSILNALSLSSVPIFLLTALSLIWFASLRKYYLADAWPLLATAGYGFAVFAFQQTGWEYQFLPVSISLFLGQFVAISLYPQSLVHFKSSKRSFAVFGLLISGLLIFRIANDNLNLPRWDRLRNQEIGQALSVVPPGTTVYIMTTTIVPGFPTVVHLDLEWGSRLPTLWPLAGLEWRRHAKSDLDSTARSKYTAELVLMVTQDFKRFSPSIVLVDRQPGQFGLPRDYDILEFFVRDPIFRGVWADYTLIGESSRYRIFARRI